VDAGTITAVVGALAALGAGIKYLIDRVDKKREKREAAVEAFLREQYAKLEAERQRERADAVIREDGLKRYNSRLKAAAGKWREQLIHHKIEPEPADWPEETDE
jgi:hypothetical protein